MKKAMWLSTCGQRASSSFASTNHRPVSGIANIRTYSARSVQCANVRTSAEDAFVFQEPCDLSTRWVLETIDATRFYLTNANGTLCANVFRGSAAEGVFIVRSQCQRGLPGFQWRRNPSRGGDQYIPVVSNRPMVVQGSSLNDGALLIQSSAPSTSDRWLLRP